MANISGLKYFIIMCAISAPVLTSAEAKLECDPKVVLRDRTGIERSVNVYTFEDYFLSLNGASANVSVSDKISFDITAMIQNKAISQPRILTHPEMKGKLVFRIWFKNDPSNSENPKVTGMSLDHIETTRDGNHKDDWAHSFVSTDLTKDGQSAEFNLLSTKGNLGIVRVNCTLHSTLVN